MYGLVQSEIPPFSKSICCFYPWHKVSLILVTQPGRLLLFLCISPELQEQYAMVYKVLKSLCVEWMDKMSSHTYVNVSIESTEDDYVNFKDIQKSEGTNNTNTYFQFCTCHVDLVGFCFCFFLSLILLLFPFSFF